MFVDGGIALQLSTAAKEAREAEEAGYDAVWAAETGQDPFLPLVVAAEHSSTLKIGTAIAVAFARNPMTVAQSAWDLNGFSGGRFLLGVGSQIKPHIERRYSMEWSKPAARMREFILAMRAIWASWQNGAKLDFSGEFYTHTLMPPFFNPGPNPHGAPKVYLAAVGPGMTEVAAETADGMLVHGFTTERYLREVTRPTVEHSLVSQGRTLNSFDFVYPALVVTGETEMEMREAEKATRKQIAFYGSTPAYRPVLELHGWGDLQPELQELSKQDRWDEMGALIDDEILDTFAVRGTPAEVAQNLHKRFSDIIDRLSFYMPYEADGMARRVLAGLRELS